MFSVLVFFDSNAQVTFSITNASSVSVNDGQVVASVNSWIRELYILLGRFEH